MQRLGRQSGMWKAENPAHNTEGFQILQTHGKILKVIKMLPDNAFIVAVTRL